jgi:Alginate lyase
MPTSASSITFKHPGTFMSPDMTHNLKAIISTDSMRKQALEKLMKAAPLDHEPQALATLHVEYNGAGNSKGHKECTRDGEVAVSAALIYWATAKREYAKLACNIISAWSIKNKVWEGDNAVLEASWSICSMARAAELLKHSPAADLWKPVEPAFLKWLDTVIMPVLKSEHIWKWKPIGNWHFSQICARMQIAILREDQAEWNWCINKYPEALNKCLIWQKCPGEHAETCRDVTHAQFALGGLVQAPEIALHQGVNLYDRRLLDCFELQARIMMQEIPTGLTKDDIHTPYGYWYEPVWHIPYAHFAGRLGIQMPYTKQYLLKLGPDRVCFHWGGNCLTHGHPKK